MTDDDVPLDTPAAMNALDAMMWRAEVDPRLRSPVTIVDLLDTEPDWERLTEAHDRATRYVPRLRQRALEPWWGWGTPEWVLDESFALDFHLRRHRLAGAGGLDDLLGLAATWAMTPLDRARPPWEAMLVTGLDDGRAAYLLKIHHSLADGLGMVQVLELLHGSTSEPGQHLRSRALPSSDDAPARHARSRHGLTARRIAERTLDLPVALGAGLGAATALTRQVVAHPVTTLAWAGKWLGSALRVAVPRQGPPSPLLAGRSLNRRFLTLDIDLDRLKRAGRAGGGSLNDAFLAAVLGGLRRYHAHFGDVPDTLPVGMPVSTRDSSHSPGGNHWAGTRFAAPLSAADPATRIADLRRLVRNLVDEPVLDGLGQIAPLLATLPAPLLVKVQGDATIGNDLQVSNIPGLSRPAFLAGARIVRSYPFGPLPGGALMVALMSHLDTCCVGVNLDPAAVTEPELFAACLRAAMDEILVLADS